MRDGTVSVEIGEDRPELDGEHVDTAEAEVEDGEKFDPEAATEGPGVEDDGEEPFDLDVYLGSLEPDDPLRVAVEQEREAWGEATEGLGRVVGAALIGFGQTIADIGAPDTEPEPGPSIGMATPYPAPATFLDVRAQLDELAWRVDLPVRLGVGALLLRVVIEQPDSAGVRDVRIVLEEQRP